jgi:hypothetical protein
MNTDETESDQAKYGIFSRNAATDATKNKADKETATNLVNRNNDVIVDFIRCVVASLRETAL